MLAVATLAVGTFASAMAPLMLARVREVAVDSAERQSIAWTRASIISAAGALAAYAYSAFFSLWGGNHRPMFLTGAGVLLGPCLQRS